MAKKPTTQLNTWEARFAESAKVAQKVEASAISRPFFNTNGQLKINGATLPNGAPLIVLDQIPANLYYEGTYNPDDPQPPACYALGRFDEEGNIIGVDTWDGRTEMAPHKDCTSRKHTDCATCPLNAFKSAENGKGKACQNTRRLAVIQAGTMQAKGQFEPFTKADQIEGSELAYVKVPVTSVKTLSKVVKDTATVLERPIWSMFTLLTSIPNPKGGFPQFVQQYEVLQAIPNQLMDAVYKRVQEAQEDITFPFAPPSPRAEAPIKGAAANKKRRYS